MKEEIAITGDEEAIGGESTTDAVMIYEGRA